jgi:Transposase IS116/IS110/IS902 family
LHILHTFGKVEVRRLAGAASMVRTWYYKLDRRYPGGSAANDAYRCLRAIMNVAVAHSQPGPVRGGLTDRPPAGLADNQQVKSILAQNLDRPRCRRRRRRALSRKRIASAITRAGRQRRSEEKTAEIQGLLRREQLVAPAAVSEAMGASVAALVAVIKELDVQVAGLEEQLTAGFDQHSDAKVVRSLPGLGTVLGARVLGEFGDDPDRYTDAQARKNYAGTSPITKASGKSKVVLARSPATSGWPTRATCRRSRPSRPAPVPGLSTTPAGPRATRTTVRYEQWQTGSSASCTVTSGMAPFTAKTSPGTTANKRSLDNLAPWDV